MTIPEILRQLQHVPNGCKFAPYETALRAAIEQREAIVPELIAAINRVAANPTPYLHKDNSDYLHLYAIYLLAQFRETQALDCFLRFFSLPGETSLDLTGDMITERGAVVLVSVCGGDPAPLLRLAHDESVNEFVRGQAIDGLLVQGIWGERGRPARPWEADETAELMRLLEAVERDAEGNERLTLLQDNWRNEDWRAALSFPEQNDKLLVAMRRYQSRAARLHRWCWFLKGDDKQQATARSEIAECDDARLVSPDLKALLRKRDPRAMEELESQLRRQLDSAPTLLVRIASRILPLRGRSWHWEKHPQATEENPLHQLTQGGPSFDSPERPVWLRGQRGLALERIEQIEELRKRFQSLNQTLRRKIGGEPPIRRVESVPDPCPDLLDKLKQLCEVFGLPVLETPAAYSSRFCSRSGVPGFRAAEVTAGFTKQGQWAWMAGKKDENNNPKEEAQRLLDLDRQLDQAQAELECDWNEQKRPGDCPKRTLLVPLSGGPVFVPISDQAADADLQPAVVQADINAAINLALRAISDPRLWTIHPRLRTQRERGDKPAKGKKPKSKTEATAATTDARLLTREKRKYGEAGKPLVVHRSADAKPDETRQPNFFADHTGLAALAERLGEQERQHAWLMKEWTSAEVSGEPDAPALVHGKSFWGCVKAAQWQRVQQINAARIAKWKDKMNRMPD